MKKSKSQNNKSKLSSHDVKILNTRTGLTNLFNHSDLDLQDVLTKTKQALILEKLAVDLVKLQSKVIEEGKKIVVIFEGRDAAGKGGAIRQITRPINPRHFKTVALNKPGEEEKGEWYFKRYIKHLPRAGEMVFFDRSWYNRAVVEPVNGFCSRKEYNIFMAHVNAFEEMLTLSDIKVIKIFLKISKKEQAKRFEKIKSKDLTKWQISEVDKKAQKLWSQYTKYENMMFKKTDTKHAPWHIIEADDSLHTRIEAIKHLLRECGMKRK